MHIHSTLYTEQSGEDLLTDRRCLSVSRRPAGSGGGTPGWQTPASSEPSPAAPSTASPRTACSGGDKHTHTHTHRYTQCTLARHMEIVCSIRGIYAHECALQ